MLLLASAIVAGFAPVVVVVVVVDAGVYRWLLGPVATDPADLKPIAALAIALWVIPRFARLWDS